MRMDLSGQTFTNKSGLTYTARFKGREKNTWWVRFEDGADKLALTHHVQNGEVAHPHDPGQVRPEQKALPYLAKARRLWKSRHTTQTFAAFLDMLPKVPGFDLWLVQRMRLTTRGVLRFLTEAEYKRQNQSELFVGLRVGQHVFPSAAEAAKAYGVSPSTLGNWLRKGCKYGIASEIRFGPQPVEYWKGQELPKREKVEIGFRKANRKGLVFEVVDFDRSKARLKCIVRFEDGAVRTALPHHVLSGWVAHPG